MSSTLYYFGFGALVVLLAFMTARAMLSSREIFKLPSLVALLGVAWLLPQAFALESLRVNEYATSGFWLYVTGCFLFAAVGFQFGQRIYAYRKVGIPNAPKVDYYHDRLILACLGIAALGWLALFLLSGVDLEALGSQWTGPAAFYSLLSKALGLSLCLSVLVFVRTRSRWALIIAVLAILPMIQTALLGVRRELLFDIVLLSVGVWAFATHRYPPRSAVLAAVLVGTIVVNTAGDLRSKVSSGEASLIEAITDAETYSQFDYFERDTNFANELRQAQFDHWEIEQFGELEFGAPYWNMLVRRYVPAFIVGREQKDSLMIVSTAEDRVSTAEQLSFHGSTRTGFSDSYRAFGGFGLLVFGLIGLFYGYLYAGAAAGALASQFAYFALLAEGLKAFTHSTAELFGALPFTLAIVFAALAFAKVRGVRRDALKERGRVELNSQSLPAEQAADAESEAGTSSSGLAPLRF